MNASHETKAVNLTSAQRGALSLFILLLTAILALSPLFPHRVTNWNASPEQFSGERAMAHLPIIAREPHPSGSPAQAKVRDYLLQQLAKIGLEAEIQQTQGLENIVARLPGTGSTGAIVILAHYDSVYGSPGAADNGSGVVTLLEIMRALAAAPALRNDIIALFDDSEEMPDVFAGTKAFVREHPWIKDVRVAIGMDIAVRGFICTDDTGSNNGRVVQALARAYTGGLWASNCGGGNYDSLPFRAAGIQVLEIEDNYPYNEQHTADDVPEVVNPGSVQQLGEQVLSVARELGGLDLSNPKGEQETYISFLGRFLIHYPEAWALPLVIIAGILLATAIGLALWRKHASWRGLAVALLAILATAGLSVIGANAVWKAAPDLLGWETNHWPEWPEVIPTYGWLVLIFSDLLVLVLMVVAYRLARRWGTRADFSLVGLSTSLAIAMLLAVSMPRGAIGPTWPVLVGSVAWIAVVMTEKDRQAWSTDIVTLLAAALAIMFILPFVPGIFMGDGTKSAAVTSGLWALAVGIVLPALDRLIVRGGQYEINIGLHRVKASPMDATVRQPNSYQERI